MDILLSVIKLFPQHLQADLTDTMQQSGIVSEEIRVKVGRPITLRCYQNEVLCKTIVTKKDLLYILGSATDCSYHSAIRHIQNGYIPICGGCRMGLCGAGGVHGVIGSMDEVTSVCVRLPCEMIGCSDELFPELTDHGFKNTIIVAPPGVGKTTLLRELIRKLSYHGLYVGVADERGEITGQYNGQAAFDLGPRCDVLTGVSKSTAAMMLLRTMSPNVIAMDEITAYSDAGAILEAVGCGVGLLTTVHGDGLSSLNKPSFSQINEWKIFEKGIFVRVEQGKRVYEVVDLYV